MLLHLTAKRQYPVSAKNQTGGRLWHLIGSALALLGWQRTKAAAQTQENGFLIPTYNLATFRPAIDSKGYVTVNASQVLDTLGTSLGLVGTWAGNPTLQLNSGQVDPTSGQTVVNGRTFAVNNLVTRSCSSPWVCGSTSRSASVCRFRS